MTKNASIERLTQMTNQILNGDYMDVDSLKDIVVTETLKLVPADDSIVQQLILRCDQLTARYESHALYIRGFMCEQGIGDNVNYPQAIIFYEQAIALNNPWAMFERAHMHAKGRGGPVDNIAAIKLYEQSIRYNNSSENNSQLKLEKINIDKSMAEPLLTCLWPDLLAGRSFTQHTLSALKDYCDPWMVVDKIIADDYGSSLVFLKQLITNQKHPLYTLISSRNPQFFQALWQKPDKSPLITLKKHASNVCNTRQVFNSVNRNPDIEQQAVRLSIRKLILPFFHRGATADHKAQLTENSQITITPNDFKTTP